jgi:hypothetical protein
LYKDKQKETYEKNSTLDTHEDSAVDYITKTLNFNNSSGDNISQVIGLFAAN